MKSGFLPLAGTPGGRACAGQLDVVLVTGDAYVDHPAFGAAVIGRVLEAAGFKVGIVAMPDPQDHAALTALGKPRLFFGITSGNVDSMVCRYTSFKRLRSDDPYVPGGKGGIKPDRAVIHYANLARRAYKDVPLVIGGIESSMRRVAHYDYWSNKVRRSIIQDSRALVLAYGMAERQIVEIARRLNDGRSPEGIPGTVIMSKEPPPGARLLPPEEEVIASKERFLEFYRLFYRYRSRLLAQPAGKRFLVHYPDYDDTSGPDLDRIYGLPFTRLPHPVYKEKIPAFQMICNSITSHRGCVSGCSFCSLGLHQGKKIVDRSAESILAEVDKIAGHKYFKGHITDIGGPSANMYGFNCKKKWRCTRESCLAPAICPHLAADASPWLDLLARAARHAGVKKVSVGSGIRYDLLMRGAGGKRRLQTLVDSHISGQLKIAPEHVSPVVLRAMRKPPLYDLENFVRIFNRLNAARGKKQYLLPYLMSCHPGSSGAEVVEMKRRIKTIFGFVPEQVQAFLPLPMTLSSVIYYTGKDPLSGETFQVERDPARRRKRHDMFFSR